MTDKGISVVVAIEVIDRIQSLTDTISKFPKGEINNSEESNVTFL